MIASPCFRLLPALLGIKNVQRGYYTSACRSHFCGLSSKSLGREFCRALPSAPVPFLLGQHLSLFGVPPFTFRSFQPRGLGFLRFTTPPTCHGQPSSCGSLLLLPCYVSVTRSRKGICCQLSITEALTTSCSFYVILTRLLLVAGSPNKGGVAK